MRIRRFYHYIGSKYALTALSEKRLKIARISELNDPFEFLCVNMRDRTTRGRLVEIKQLLNQQIGIICFSETFRSPVMWAHYGDRHTGLCLGFDVLDGGGVLDVEYTYSRLNVTAQLKPGVSAYDDFGKNLLATKHQHWSYEQESRLICDLNMPDNGLYFEPFSGKMRLKEIFIGFKSDISRDEVERQFGEASNKIKTAFLRPAFGEYEMTVDKRR
ncbi:MAG: hypothetical protein ACJAXR_001795 [Halopseudomonas sp.]|jgi:hypothetical protein|uniref:DUF2971 domain-containing protein n=1 Tax=Halopseudomonas sp. TaxID=2901191 RepID=UPI0039E2810A